mgnify:CR=1 FL=1
MVIWALRCGWRRLCPKILEPAPFRSDLADAPEPAKALWRTTTDAVRVRIVLWPLEGATGTVLIFPGRTEFAEKYGHIARHFHAAGLAVVTIDWRGQGLSDRLAHDALLGHVLSFPDYQRDVAEMLFAAAEMDLPKPWRLVAHSMGGAIGLRALIEGLPVDRAVFSAPMWGIAVPAHKRPMAFVLPTLARHLGRHLNYVPGTGPDAYVSEADFRTNMLTHDAAHFEYLGRMAAEEPRFALGGPSLHWFDEAVRECRSLAAMPRPTLPVQTFVGTDESIVSVAAIRNMHAAWPSGSLKVLEGARHELMMEAEPWRSDFLDPATSFLT